MNPARTRVAVVGAGYFGRFHCGAWSRIEEGGLVGLCTRSGHGAAEVAAAFGVPAIFTELGQMLDAAHPHLLDMSAHLMPGGRGCMDGAPAPRSDGGGSAGRRRAGG